jgi:hypothetical protein
MSLLRRAPERCCLSGETYETRRLAGLGPGRRRGLSASRSRWVSFIAALASSGFLQTRSQKGLWL